MARFVGLDAGGVGLGVEAAEEAGTRSGSVASAVLQGSPCTLPGDEAPPRHAEEDSDDRVCVSGCSLHY